MSGQLVSADRQTGSTISIDGVTKTFGGKHPTTAIENATLDIRGNEFISLIGPSGCGKTTLMRIIGDLIPASSGTVLIDGDNPEVARKKRKYGFVFQEATLLQWKTIEENIELPLVVIGVPKSERARIVQELLVLVGLDGFAKHYPDQVSGGMQQRAAIARALSFDPSVLLMDEPFGALDLITRDKMCTELLRIWEERRKTVVFVTHSIHEAILLSDRVAVLSTRPSRIAQVVEIDLPRPRNAEVRESPEFAEYEKSLRNLLEL